MNCPHLSDNCKINRDVIKVKKCQLIDRVENDSTTRSNVVVAGSAQKIWRCSECLSAKENWMCLSCGSVLCGRYVKAHALNHFNTNHHTVCMNTLNYSIYCYKCDDFVINETQNVDDIRQELKGEDDSCSETSTNPEESISSKSQQETISTSSSDSGWEEPRIGRKLRPRKRTMSSDSNETTTPTTKRKTLRKVVGLRNLGNTCFMNSVLQSLSNIQEFSYYFSTLPCLEPTTKQKHQRVYHSRSIKENLSDANVVEELRKVLINLSKGGDGSKAISPECLFLVIWKVVPQFRGHRQHDAHEFLRYMLDRLHTELQHVTVDPPSSPSSKQTGIGKSAAAAIGTTNNSISETAGSNCSGGGYTPKGSRNSIVTSVFGGILQSEVRCLICGVESKKHDPFLDLSLDIPEKFYKECDEANNSTSPVCNINDCLSSFTEVEELTETELYYCSSCKCKQKSTKRFWIRRLPNVLCLHIKRFRWNNFFRTKIDLRISFPIKSLDMSQYVLNNGPETRRNTQSNNIYDLAAVIVHHGNGSSCGHYTSFAINNGTWMHFNDHTVKEVPPTAVSECKPYILFYIRRDVNSNNNKT